MELCSGQISHGGNDNITEKGAAIFPGMFSQATKQNKVFVEKQFDSLCIFEC